MQKRRNFIKLIGVGFLGLLLKPPKARAYLFLAPLAEFIGANIVRMVVRTFAKKAIQTVVRSGVRRATGRAITSAKAKKVVFGSAMTSFAVDLAADEIENRIFTFTENEIARRLNYPKGNYEALWIIDEHNVINKNYIKNQHKSIEYTVQNSNSNDIMESLKFEIVDIDTQKQYAEKSIPIMLPANEQAELEASFDSSDITKTGIMRCRVQNEMGDTLKESGLIIVEKMENLKKIV